MGEPRRDPEKQFSKKMDWAVGQVWEGDGRKPEGQVSRREP